MNIKVGGMGVYNVPGEQAAIMKYRAAFVQEYCHQKGWDYNELSISQVLEIRRQKAWESPLQGAVKQCNKLGGK